MTAEEKLQAATNALKKVLSAVQRYLPPDGISERDAMNEIIEAVDPWPLGEVGFIDRKGSAEEKIKEVMEFVDTLREAQGDYIMASFGNDDKELNRVIEAEDAIKAKLKELIKDDEHGL